MQALMWLASRRTLSCGVRRPLDLLASGASTLPQASNRMHLSNIDQLDESAMTNVSEPPHLANSAGLHDASAMLGSHTRSSSCWKDDDDDGASPSVATTIPPTSSRARPRRSRLPPPCPPTSMPSLLRSPVPAHLPNPRTPCDSPRVTTSGPREASTTFQLQRHSRQARHRQSDHYLLLGPAMNHNRTGGITAQQMAVLTRAAPARTHRPSAGCPRGDGSVRPSVCLLVFAVEPQCHNSSAMAQTPGTAHAEILRSALAVAEHWAD